MSEGIQAPELLERAVAAMKGRAAERDCEAERSMAGCVGAFNALFGKELSVEEGWFFMVLLKVSRASAGAFQVDDYVDGPAYFALAGEAAARLAEEVDGGGEAALGDDPMLGVSEDCHNCTCNLTVRWNPELGRKQCERCGWVSSRLYR